MRSPQLHWNYAQVQLSSNFKAAWKIEEVIEYNTPGDLEYSNRQVTIDENSD